MRKRKKRLEEVMELYHEGKLRKEAFEHHHSPIFEWNVQIKRQISEISAEIDFLKIHANATDGVIEGARTLQNQWSLLSFDEKRKIIESVVERINIGESEIDITLSHLPTISPSPGPLPLLNKSYNYGYATMWL